MIREARVAQGERVIVSDGLYMAVFDADSPVRRKGTRDRAWRAFRSDSQEHPALLDFNRSWLELQRAGHLVIWPLVFDGVFRVRVSLWAQDSALPSGTEGNSLGAERPMGTLLECSSGRILVSGLGQIEDPHATPVLQVAPGAYILKTTTHDDQIARHEGLKTASDYPQTEGPDFEIDLRTLRPGSPSPSERS